jgi:hypothetical protein
MTERGYIGNKLHHISGMGRLMTSLTTPILSYITPVSQEPHSITVSWGDTFTPWNRVFRHPP